MGRPCRQHFPDPNPDDPDKVSVIAYYYRNVISSKEWRRQEEEFHEHGWKKCRYETFSDHIRDSIDDEIFHAAKGDSSMHLCDAIKDGDGNPRPSAYDVKDCPHSDPRKAAAAIQYLQQHAPQQLQALQLPIQQLGAPSFSSNRQLRIEAPPKRLEIEGLSQYNAPSRRGESKNGESGRASEGITQKMNQASPSVQNQIRQLIENDSKRRNSSRSSNHSEPSGKGKEPSYRAPSQSQPSYRGIQESRAARAPSKLNQVQNTRELESRKRDSQRQQSITSSDGRSLEQLGFSRKE
ncbi:hypothetical protein N7G274_009298 [Stereocaulon virgatum]|uniref:Uncharacterized protein n=1 Tax=Stereocaulon virgatum TaxID=373712 RepID=A0ABR4A407_9LECA